MKNIIALLKPISFFALCLAMIETLLIGAAKLTPATKADFSSLDLATASGSTVIWSVLLGFIVAALVARKRFKNPVIRLILFTLLCATLGFILIIMVVGWTYQIMMGVPASDNIIRFYFENFSAMQLHMLQTSPALILITWCFLLCLTGGLVWLANSIVIGRGQSFSSNHTTSIYVIVCYIFFFAPELSANHPLVSSTRSLFVNTELNHVLDSHNIVRKSLDSGETLLVKHAEHPVIVILLESFRHDLKLLDPSPIPNLLEAAQQGIYFDKSYATSTHSNYSDLSIWYSQYPLRTSGLFTYHKDDARRGKSAFSLFKDQGYTTGYVSSQNETWGSMIEWLDTPEIDYFYHSENYHGDTFSSKGDTGFNNFFERYKTAGKIEDSETLKVTREWIESLPQKNKFFLGVNLQNTHFGYVLPVEAKQPFQPTNFTDDGVYAFGTWPLSQARNIKNRYLNSVYNLDHQLGLFFNFLKEKGIWDNAYVVVIGDNGEAFGEHGYVNHAGSLHDEQVRTFSFIKPPKGVPASTFENAISHIDILPGVLDLMGLPQPKTFQGISPFKRGGDYHVYMHANSIATQDGLVDWPWKAIINTQSNERELYQLLNDPDEKYNLVGRGLIEEERLFYALRNWRAKQLEYYADPSWYLTYYPPT